jgi:hypothetical protein
MEDLDIRFANANEASVTDHELLDVFFALHETFLAFTHGSIREEPALVLRAVKELLPDFDETWVFPQKDMGTGFAADIGICPLRVKVSQLIGALSRKEDFASF